MEFKNTVHCMVDVQLGCITHLSLKGAEKYLDKMGQATIDMRGQGIPTVWISINDQNSLFAGGDNAQAMAQAGFTAMHGNNLQKAEYQKLYKDFLARYGPEKDEIVFSKRFLDSFMDAGRLKDNPSLYGHLLTHRPDETAPSILSAAQGGSLANKLKSMEVKDVLISGMVSDVCVLETAIGARIQGFNADILVDLIADGRDRDHSKTGAEYDAEIRNILHDIIHQPQKLGDDPTKMALTCDEVFTKADREKMQTIGFSSVSQTLTEKMQSSVQMEIAGKIPAVRKPAAAKFNG